MLLTVLPNIGSRETKYLLMNAAEFIKLVSHGWQYFWTRIVSSQVAV